MKASPCHTHTYPPRPFIIIPFSQPLSNPRSPQKLLHPKHPVYTLMASHPTALGTTCHGWAGGCRQTPTQVQCWIVTCPRDRDILGVLSSYSSGGPWVLGSPGGLGCAVGLAHVGPLLGLWGCSGPCPAAPGDSHVPHTSSIMASSSGFPTYTWLILSQALTSFCGYYCHHHSKKKSKRGWCPQILPASGLSSTAPSPASPHLPPVPSGPSFPTVFCIPPPTKDQASSPCFPNPGLQQELHELPGSAQQ